MIWHWLVLHHTIRRVQDTDGTFGVGVKTVPLKCSCGKIWYIG